MGKFSVILRVSKIIGFVIIAILLWNSNGELNHKLSQYEKAETIKIGNTDNGTFRSVITTGGGQLLICTDDKNCLNLVSELKEDFSDVNSFHLIIIGLTIFITLAELPEIIREIKKHKDDSQRQKKSL